MLKENYCYADAMEALVEGRRINAVLIGKRMPCQEKFFKL